jgi:hypothetical protein
VEREAVQGLEGAESSAPWRPSGVVTLLTDFGLQDAYVGVMKGVLLARVAHLRIVDLTHAIAAQDILGAAWQLAQAWPFFPTGSVHVAVVDPGVGSERSILVAEDRGHAFLAPDNGLLGPVLSGAARVFELDLERYARPETSRTFHGRDLFAPAAAALAGGLEPRELGPPAESGRGGAWPEVQETASGELRVEVLCVDHFGNLITTLPAARLAGAAWSVWVGTRELPLLRTYADVEPGEPLALIGSCGTLEVSVRDGHAGALLDARAGSQVCLRRRAR